MFKGKTNFIENFITKNPKRTIAFLSKFPPQLLEYLAQKKVLEGFRYAAKTLPAYKKFLKEKGIDPRKIKTIEDFKKLPHTTKQNYVLKYDVIKQTI